jgi:hypothetical protein
LPFGDELPGAASMLSLDVSEESGANATMRQKREVAS